MVYAQGSLCQHEFLTLTVLDPPLASPPTPRRNHSQNRCATLEKRTDIKCFYGTKEFDEIESGNPITSKKWN